MNIRISKRMSQPDFQGAFTADILKAAANPSLISFAGGLPNPVSFPVEEMDAATNKVLARDGVRALQYSGAQGYPPLIKFILISALRISLLQTAASRRLICSRQS